MKKIKTNTIIEKVGKIGRLGRKRRNTNTYKTNVGGVPGTMIYTGTKTDKDIFIEVFDYKANTLINKELKTIEEAFSYKTSETVSWININGLNHLSEIEAIGNHFGIHPLILEDIVNISQRPKIDEYDDYIFVSLKMLYEDPQHQIAFEQISLILGHNYVLTFQESEGDIFDPIRDRIRNAKGRICSLDADYLLYTLLDAIIDHYYIVIENMGDKIEDLEDLIFAGNTKDAISGEIQDLKREIIKIRRNVVPLRDIIARLENNRHKLMQPKTLHYYKDAYDHIIQISESVEVYRDMTMGLMDMYMSTISNKMNEVMKVLTIMASIFIPLTFIAGVYGMNFDNMPELHYKYGYFAVWGVMILVFVIMIFYFKRKKWL